MIRRLASALALLAAALLAAHAPARAQAAAVRPHGVGIHVVDASDAPIAGARVAVVGGAEGISNESGWVRLAGVQAGRIFVLVTRLGYRPTEFNLDVPASGTMEVDVELEPAAVAVAGVTAVGRRENAALAMGGFYRRKETGQGSFLTRDDIEKTRAQRTSEVFRRVRGVRVVPAGNDRYKLQTVRYGMSLSQTTSAMTRPGRRGESGGQNTTCEMLVFLDGVLVQLNGIDDIRMESLEAIEVYRGAGEIPAEYRITNASCGVVVLWTRTGA